MEMKQHIIWILAEYREAKNEQDKMDALNLIEETDKFLSEHPEIKVGELKEELQQVRFAA